MATTKPRITVTLEPATYAVLKRMSDVGGESMSALVGSLVELAAPTLTRAAHVIEAAKGADQKALDAFVSALGAAEARLAPLLSSVEGLDDELGDLFAGFSEGARKLQEQPQEAAPVHATGTERKRRRGSPGKRSGAFDPRRCNHGGQSGTDEEHEGGGQ